MVPPCPLLGFYEGYNDGAAAGDVRDGENDHDDDHGDVHGCEYVLKRKQHYHFPDHGYMGGNDCLVEQGSAPARDNESLQRHERDHVHHPM